MVEKQAPNPVWVEMENLPENAKLKVRAITCENPHES
jgi:hypothetical protein